jgi:hypothetical protein
MAVPFEDGDTESLLPGDRWKDKIKEANEHHNYCIALISARSICVKKIKDRLFFPYS